MNRFEIIPEEQKEPTEALAIQSQAKQITVRTMDELVAANELLIGVKKLRRKIDDEFNPGIAQAHEHHKFLVAQKKRFTDPLDAAEWVIKPKIRDFMVEQDRLRLQAEREAELSRQAQEKAAEKISDRANELIEEGKLTQADKVIERGVEKLETMKAQAPLIPPKAEAEGLSVRENWKWRVIDEALVPRKFLMLDEKKLTAYARAMKHQAHEPGLEFYPEKSVASRVGK